MAKMADAALKQIDQKYAKKFTGGDTRVVRLALVVARRTYVFLEFQVTKPLMPNI
jgi:ABC-type enterochelin transport system ATPase subunit